VGRINPIGVRLPVVIYTVPCPVRTGLGVRWGRRAPFCCLLPRGGSRRAVVGTAALEKARASSAAYFSEAQAAAPLCLEKKSASGSAAENVTSAEGF